MKLIFQALDTKIEWQLLAVDSLFILFPNIIWWLLAHA
jgi:hypothetical protein